MSTVISNHHTYEYCSGAIVTSVKIIIKILLQSQLTLEITAQMLSECFGILIVYLHLELFRILPVLIVAPSVSIVFILHSSHSTRAKTRASSSQVVPLVDINDRYDDTVAESITQFCTKGEDISGFHLNAFGSNSNSDSDGDNDSVQVSVAKLNKTDDILDIVNARIKQLV